MKLCLVFIILIFNICAVAQSNVELLEMSPKDFFNHSVANQEIDVEHPNNHLLTIATFQATNLLRNRLRLSLFEPDQTLYKASNVHINEMVSKNFFNHINPYSERYHTPVNRVNSQGGVFMIVAENIALVPLFKSKKQGRYRYRVVNGKYKYFDIDNKPLRFMTYGEFGKSLVDDWYKSIGHRKNLLNEELTHLGLAIKVVKNYERGGDLPEAYAVQNFGTKY